MNTRQCKSCRALIFWAITQSGKKIPLDAVPTSTGNAVLTDQKGELPLARILKKGEGSLDDGLRYMPHHATCSFASRHRAAR